MKTKLKWEQVMEDHYNMLEEEYQEEMFTKPKHIYESENEKQ
jgi:hypothetical protein